MGRVRAALSRLASRRGRRTAEPHSQCVPGAATATAPESKFVNYLLNENHDEGASKANLLLKLGFTTANWRDLQGQLLEQLPLVPAVPKQENGGGGRNYSALMTITGPSGKAQMTTIWSANPDGTTHLVTIYKSRKRSGG
jgi:Domain of unknown function (DUF6883)